MPVISALLLLATDARADLRVALRNDVFTELIPPIDDSGFTHDFEIQFWRPSGDYVIGGALIDRWITEDTRFVGGRRRDQLDLLGTLDRTWATPRQAITAGVRLGPTLTGNLGGRWMQNGWHTLCGCGSTLADGLQDRYEGDGDVGALAGGRVRGELGNDVVQGFGFVDGALALGTGVSAIEGAVGARVGGRAGRIALGAQLELAVMRFHVVDDRLALPGAYRRGLQGAWRLGMHVAWSRYRIDYEYRANEDGSGEPIGVVAFTIKQAGTAF